MMVDGRMHRRTDGQMNGINIPFFLKTKAGIITYTMYILCCGIGEMPQEKGKTMASLLSYIDWLSELSWQ